MIQSLRALLSILSALCLAAGPRAGDLVELQGFVNARSQAKFRKSDDDGDKRYVLQAGTKAEVLEVKYFANTGNYGVRVQLINADGVQASENRSLWVYYNVKTPAMKLYSITDSSQRDRILADWNDSAKVKAYEVNTPSNATHAVVTQPTPALPDPGSPPQASPTPTPDPVPAPPVEAITDVNAINQALDSLQPGVVCAACQAAQAQYAQCNGKNDYLESQIDSLQSGGVTNALLGVTPPYPKLEACVRESMTISGGRAALCAIGDDLPTIADAPACVSQRLVMMVDNAFSMTTDCLAGFVNGRPDDDQAEKQTFRDVMELINLESGFRPNAYNPSGAAGLGQFTNGAIESVNKNGWNQMQSYINSSKKNSCQTLKNMNLQPARAKSAALCDRMGLSQGNPVENMLYTLADMKITQSDVMTSLKRGLSDNNLQISKDLTEKLAGALTVWGHNTGPYGITAPLNSLLASTDGQQALQSGHLDQFLSLLQDQVSSFTLAYGERHDQGGQKLVNRAKEASGFYENVRKKMKTLENKVGRSCSL